MTPAGAQGHGGEALQPDAEPGPEVAVGGAVALEAGPVPAVARHQGEGGPAHGRAQPAALRRAAADHAARSGRSCQKCPVLYIVTSRVK